MREFEERRRREVRQLVTRRAMIIGSAAAVVGLVAIPFLPRGKKLDPKDLLKPGIAEADPEIIRELALHFHRHPDVRIRQAAVALLFRFKDDLRTHAALAHLARKDAVASIRHDAVEGLVTFDNVALFDIIGEVYWSDPGVRSKIDELVMVAGLDSLKTHIERHRP